MPDWQPLGRELLIRYTVCSLCMLTVILDISLFGFVGGTLFTIASVPSHRFYFTFYIMHYVINSNNKAQNNNFIHLINIKTKKSAFVAPLYFQLSCRTEAYFMTSPGRKSPPMPSNEYWMGIKVSLTLQSLRRVLLHVTK